MKQAILVVAFGTTVDSARKDNIESVVERMQDAYPDYHVKLAFSSRIIVKRLRDRGIFYQTEQGAMEDLIKEGYTTIYVQPLHITGGEEYDKLKFNIMAYADQVEVLRIGRPLLFYLGQENHPNDYQVFINAFIKHVDIPEGDGLLLVGHGGISSGNSSYGMLQYELIRHGLYQVHVATLECAPYLEDAALPWEWLDGKKPKHIHIHPLFLVLGDHALNDLFGEQEDSVVNILEDAGYATKSIAKGLGAYREIQDIYVQHVQDVINDKYGKRSHHRPAIPTIK